LRRETLGVAGLGLASYFYRASEVKPEISWNSLNQIVFDYSSTRPAVKVLDRQGTEITTDLYASQFTIWNSGNMRLDNVDAATLIRTPLTFYLNGDGRIVNASITYARENHDGDWEMTMTPTTAAMHWRHFDTNSGAKILILYTGNHDTTIFPAITVADYSVLNHVTRIRPDKMSVAWLYFAISTAVVGVIRFLIGRLLSRIELSTRFRYTLTKDAFIQFVMVEVFATILLVIWMGNYYLTVVSPLPPF
jgi:hypothetical protein